MIDIDGLMELINVQMKKIIKQDETYSKYNVVISSEQQFVKTKVENGNIYMVVKFLPASINFGQDIVPITINAISERNKLEVCQRLLIDYAEAYNLTSANDDKVSQVYSSPSVLSNFNEIFDGFRSILYLSGTFLISEKSNPFDVYYNDEKIECITMGDSFDIQLDTQAFFSGNNFTQSKATIGTHSFTFSTYVVDNDLINKVINQKFGNVDLNEAYNFKFVYKNGLTFEGVYYLGNASSQQNIAELPMISLTFTR